MYADVEQMQASQIIWNICARYGIKEELRSAFQNHVNSYSAGRYGIHTLMSGCVQIC